jgi:sulfite reductase beta subunit-like hemoprotein
MPKLAPTLYEFVPVEDMLKVCEAVLRVYNAANELRRDRMMARIKVLVNKVGMDKFREMVEEELKEPWAQEDINIEDYIWEDPGDVPAPDPGRPLLRRLRAGETSPEYTRWRITNVVEQRQFGFHGVYVKIPNGDLSPQQFHGLADLTRRYGNRRAMLTAEQNMLLRWVRQEDLYDLWEGLSELDLGEGGVHEVTDVTSCPGTDSCKLGITNSMGLSRQIVEAVRGYDDPLVKAMHIKISGCPNGCGRHHVADIGFHGASFKGDESRQVPSYEVFLGGRFENGPTTYGQRIKVKLPAKKVPEAVQRIIGYYTDNRAEEETFKGFIDRVGPKTLEPVLADMSRSAEKFDRDSLPLYMDWERNVLYVVERGEGECAV